MIRGLLIATGIAIAVIWGIYLVDPARDLVGSIALTVLCTASFVLAWRMPRAKVAIVRFVQRWTVNPVMRLCLRIGINPLGVALLETRGRTSGMPRCVPVGDGRVGDEFWIIAEHGMRAQYVRNIQADARVRIRRRLGLRYIWFDGIAEIRPDEDPLARQRRIIAWHPLRALNALMVRLLAVELVVVRVRLIGRSPIADEDGPASRRRVRAGSRVERRGEAVSG